MALRLSTISEGCDAVTHAGMFHADEVMSTAILSHCGVHSVARVVSVPGDIPATTMVYDIGGGAYDHHQPGGNGSRESGILYSSCGLIWRDYGRRACAEILGGDCESFLDDIWDGVDCSLIQPIDAADNGAGTRDEAGFTRMISEFNPRWDSDEDANEAFLRAVEFSDAVLRNRIRAVSAVARAKWEVVSTIRRTKGKVMVLDRYLPWQETLESEETLGEQILFVVFPALRGGYHCQCVSLKGKRNMQKCAFPNQWRGLYMTDLRALTGVPTASFCHPRGFLCGAETQEDAIKLAELAMKEK